MSLVKKSDMPEDQVNPMGIGGFLGLELPESAGGYHPSRNAVASGRVALLLIARSKGYKTLLLPEIYCGDVAKYLRVNGIGVSFYAQRDSLFPSPNEAKPGVATVIVNYFGLLTEEIARESVRFGEIIIDNCHAFFDQGIPGVPSFNSARKFFGVPDGAYIVNAGQDVVSGLPERELGSDGLAYLIDRLDERKNCLYDYRIAENRLGSASPQKISRFAARILESIDYDRVKSTRRRNFETLHQHIGNINQFDYLNLGKGCVPLTYPFQLKNQDLESLRIFLKGQRVYCPFYWPADDSTMVSEASVNWSRSIVSLPIDQRYSEQEMMRIIKLFGVWLSEVGSNLGSLHKG